ncbi:hypothetical protein EUTSA_v10016738mg [Eutrema salsugineum]|uniref:Uncharacterized protein n=1 Tax=Eutrema salsugineum TaxID=72664 RepID=V4MIC4_EUTSA|nr:hypothetical protein EUTSA_v10016738mg [Eutrema salsugineum]
MDRRPDFPETFARLKCESVDDSIFDSIQDKMNDVKHFLMEPKYDNMAVDSFLGLGMETMGISSKMEEFSHGFDFSFLPDYGGLHSCKTQDGEAGLKLEILDGFLDEVDEVEDIYASHDLSSIGNETEVKKKVSESDGHPYGLTNFSSESYSPGISGSIGFSEWSNETVRHTDSKNVSSGKVKDSLATNSNDMRCFYESEDDKKPLSTFIGSWVGRGKRRKKNFRNTSSSRLDSLDGTTSCVSYDFRPRNGPLKKCIHTKTEHTISDDQQTSSESEDYISVTNRSKSRSDRRKHQRMWTVDEVVKLLDGISHFGVGKWTDIKNLFFDSASYRTPIDIRDKWRNLLKACCNIKYNDEEAEEKRRSASRTIPKDILLRVRELASLDSKSLCFAHDYSRSRSTSNRKKKRS